MLAPGALEPEWANAFVLLEDNKIGGIFCPGAKIFGLSVLLEVEPLHIKHIGVSSIGLIFWADAHMRALAMNNNLKGYTFVTSNPAFQRLCERHLPVTGHIEGDAKRYFRLF